MTATLSRFVKHLMVARRLHTDAKVRSRIARAGKPNAFFAGSGVLCSSRWPTRIAQIARRMTRPVYEVERVVLRFFKLLTGREQDVLI